ncbi:MAG: hypothetical protein WD624_02230, partial [Rhodospirillales bacterium]
MPADDPIRNLALAAIDAERQIDAMMQPVAGSGLLAFSTLFRYANDPGFELSDDAARCLAKNPAAMADLERLIAQSALVHLPTLAAAASETLTRRETAEAIILMTPSRADPGQVYLSIDLMDAEAKRPTHLFAGSSGVDWHKLVLPPFAGPRTQVLLEAGHPILAALGDPRSVVY